MKNILINAMEKSELVSIYTDKDETNNFAVGFVQAIDEDFILISHIGPEGLYDGYMIKQINNIYRLEKDGQYEEKILKLYRRRNQEHKSIDIFDDNILKTMIEFAKNNKLFVSIELCGSGYLDVKGLVLDSSDTITVEQYDDYGNVNGKAFIDAREITEMRCDTDDEIALKILAGTD